MPASCCMIGCNTGKRRSGKEKLHLFHIPKHDDELKSKWLKAIRRKDFKPSKWSVVCYKHFQESDIIKPTTNVVNKSGELIYFPLKVKLKDGAVPSVNLNNAYEEKHKIAKTKSHELSAAKTSSRKRRAQSKTTVLKSEPENSSDDDIPLEELRNQIIESPYKSVVEDTDDFYKDSDKTLKKKFKKLLEDYELLKEKNRGLDQEIQVLESVNIELKCKLFKC